MAKRKYKKRKATKKRASKIDLTIVGLLILSILLGVLIYGKSGVVGIKLNVIESKSSFLDFNPFVSTSNTTYFVGFVSIFSIIYITFHALNRILSTILSC